MKDGKLSISDLTLWLDRSRAAVNNWTRLNSRPRDIYLEEVTRRVRILETLIYRAKGPLIPYSVGSRERPKFLKELYNANQDTRVPARRPAK